MYKILDITCIIKYNVDNQTTSEKEIEMKNQSYLKEFETEDQAREWMQMKNRAHAQGDKQIFAVVDGANDNYAVVDLKTAIELEANYYWSV